MNKLQKQRAQWYAINLGYLVIILGAINTGSLLFTVPVLVVGWLTVATAVISKLFLGAVVKHPDILDKSDTTLKHIRRPVHPVISTVYDLAILALLVYGGWHVLAVGYAVHAAIIPLMYKDFDTLLERGLIE